MDMGSVINHFDWKSHLPDLQRYVAMALLHLGKPRQAQEILLRKPIVLPDGTLKANLNLMDVVGNPPPLIPFNQASDLEGQDGVEYAFSTPSFSDLSPEELQSLEDGFVREALDAFSELLATGSRKIPWSKAVKEHEDYADGETYFDTTTAFIEERTPLFTTYPGDLWGDLVILHPDFFYSWVDDVLNGNVGMIV